MNAATKTFATTTAIHSRLGCRSATLIVATSTNSLKGDQTLRVETTYDDNAGDYVVIVQAPSARYLQRFPNLVAFRTCLMAIERHLDADSWLRTGPTVSLPPSEQGRNM